MNEMELQTTLDPIEMDMGDPEIVYSPVFPNPEGEPTDDLTKVQIQGNIYKVKDPEVHDWARAEEKPTYTKDEVGLGNVDNTSDMDKPVSTATQTALDNKVDKVAGKGLSEEDFTHTLKAKLDGIENGAEVNVQSDFAQSDNSADDFIKNKPTKLSDFDNDEGFIDNSVNNLANYYKKSETYTKAEVNSALDLKVDKVNGKGLSTNDYDDTAKSIVDNVTINLATKVDKVEGKGLSKNDFTDTLKDKLDGIEAEANKTVVDNSVTATSTNPVESKAIYNMLNDLLPEATETGNPIAISNASGLNAKSLKVELEPIQDLHGYDKPWVGGGGKNKFDKEAVIIHDRRIATSTGGVYTSNGYSVSPFIPVQAGVQYALTTTITSYIAWYSSDSQSSFISGDSWLNQTAKTVPTGANYLRFDFPTDQADKVQFEAGSSATSYEPYSNICPISSRNSLDITVNGNTETINFGETVYGGNCDVVNGGTVVTNPETTKVKLSSLDWTYQDNFQRFFTGSLSNKNMKTPPNLNTKLDGFYCECYKNTAFVSYQSGDIAVSNTGNIFVKDDNYTDVTTWLQAVGDYYISYPLKTPTTINTPATTISLNKGNNTLSTSGDNMDLKYSKIPQ